MPPAQPLQPIREDSEDLRMNGATKRLAGMHSTYLKAVIGSMNCDCLLDTGSEASLLPSSIVDLCSITRTSQTLKAANGTVILILGDVTVKMKIGQFETHVSGLVSEHIMEVMLEIDWLTSNGVVWAFEKSRIMIDRRFYRLYARSGNDQWCRRASLQEDTVVPPRS